MSIGINKLRSITLPVQPADLNAARTPAGRNAGLFGTSSYTDVAGQALPGGVALPSLSQDDLAQAQALFSGVSDEHREKLDVASRQLARALYADVASQQATAQAGGGSQQQANASTSDGDEEGVDWSKGLQSDSRAPQAEHGSRALQAAVQPAGRPATTGAPVVAAAPQTYSANPGSTAATGNAMNTYLNAIGSHSVLTDTEYDRNIGAVTYMGIIGLQNELGDYAQVVNRQNGVAAKVRTQLANLNDTVSNWPAGTPAISFTWTELDKDNNAVEKSGLLTKDQAQAQAKNLTDVTNSMQGTSNEMQLALQNKVQQYQQAVTTLSNLMKSSFDTVKGIVSNLRIS